MGQRRRARECALQILFQLEFNPADPKDLIRVYWEHQRASKEIRDYGTWIVETILAHGQAIDEAIQADSKNWRLARMAVVDRLILRLASYELLFERDTPASVAIDEALELARTFSSDDAVRFVNGILDAIRRTLERA